MKTYQLLVDVWEGQLEVDEATLLANGVAGMLIRLNDMNGGHHMDQNFTSQWKQAQNMLRAPYFVYNPWVSGSANYFWLNENMPADAKTVMIDVEVSMSGYSPVTYAAEVKKFCDLAKKNWNIAIYTAEWFLRYLSAWPTDVDYWWAQYPTAFYPSGTRQLTWEQLRTELEPFTGPSNAMKCPGALRMWQFTGDRLILPGSTRQMDVNAFFGTRAELEAWLGGAGNGDVMTQPYEGVKRVTGTQNGWGFSLMISDPRKVRFEVVHFKSLDYRGTGAEAYQFTKADVVWSGGEWDKYISPYMPRDYSVSNGNEYVPRKEAVPSLLVLDDGSVAIDHEKRSSVRQAISGLRYIVLDGKIPSYLFGTEPQYTEGHSRAIDGVDANGFHMRLTAEGVYPNQGLTLLQAAQLMLEYGAVRAHDEGGGGDVTEIIGGELQNVPEDGNMRRLPEFLTMKTIGGSMIYGTAKEVLGKTGTIRTSPEVLSGNDTGKRVQAYTTIEFVEVVDGKSVPADKWFKLPDGNYLNYIISGRAYYQIVTQPIPDVPPADGVADMPYTFTLGGGDSPYVETTITGIVKAK